ncbi:DUF6415 family natural product biosynthesis protein [Streptomyces sp. NPDC004520]|uniref:DUF6415 family natural product biosynthesis protein n=1 Tax=Streptomyces sp. NPDC004520 TaxID=3364702 RepID=UPI003687F3EB
MYEQTEHTRPAGPTVEVHLGALVLQAVDAVEEHAEDAALLVINQVLSMYGKPGDLEIAQLTDRLLTHCANLAVGVETIPEGRRPQRGQGALTDWAQLQKDGPRDGPLGTWSYVRQLALVARNMVSALREHRAAPTGRAPYVGRPDRPPFAPSTP